jgi:hypothetical protein
MDPNDGETALHKAAKNGHLQACVVLMEHGASTSALDRRGNKPVRCNLCPNLLHSWAQSHLACLDQPTSKVASSPRTHECIHPSFPHCLATSLSTFSSLFPPLFTPPPPPTFPPSSASLTAHLFHFAIRIAWWLIGATAGRTRRRKRAHPGR